MQTQRCLDQSDYARCNIEMPKIGLDRTNGAEDGIGCVRAIGGCKSRNLDRITDGRGGSVCFKLADGTHIEIATPQCKRLKLGPAFHAEPGVANLLAAVVAVFVTAV